MTKGLKLYMRHCLNASKYLVLLLIVLSTYTAIACAGDILEVIRAVPVKEKITLDALIKDTEKAAPPESDIETAQIAEIQYGKNESIYIVPVRSNVGEQRGCYAYSFDRENKFKQKIVLSNLEELESCEIIKTLFSCNREQKSTSGIVVLYGKRLGGNHYWFEGSYLIIDHSGTWREDKSLSKRLNDIDMASKAKKKLGCR